MAEKLRVLSVEWCVVARVAIVASGDGAYIVASGDGGYDGLDPVMEMRCPVRLQPPPCRLCRSTSRTRKTGGHQHNNTANVSAKFCNIYDVNV